MDRIIGREEQKAKLKSYFASDSSEFVVVYGRRRVGKTFLIREYFNNTFDFQITGLANAGMKEQLINFHASVQKYQPSTVPFADTWFNAFQQLIELLERSKSNRKLVFIDELPWL
ncbi:MAG: ATP-binding protein, partial [Mariniphaga sp.]